MKYKSFTLDPFQISSIESLEKGNSVIVSASTGTGKTLIADYIINEAIKTGKRIFYTAPIKALSNQKFKDFKIEYGEDKIGLLTGDISINPSAQIVIMTTEIYRNMLMIKDPIVNDLSHVVFDEIHYINDRERGTVWEESIIFSAEHTRFLCLSATIPNAREFADWISTIKHHTVDVVEYKKRAVPLTHLVYEKRMGLTTAKEAKELSNIPEYKVSKRKRKREKPSVATHLDVIQEIKIDHLPAIFFTFSRKACEEKGIELSRKENLTTPKEKAEIIKIVREDLNPEIKNMVSTNKLRRVLPKGIAFHHAGMLPKLKEIVEKLFAKGLIKVLYATETFAVGINMPAKTVCFNTIEKYDGIEFRYLNSKEYFQMAGRAGRRGIDKEGRSIVLIESNTDLDKVIKITSQDVDPIISQFKLSTNTVLNLIDNNTPEEIKVILKLNFDYYLRTKNGQNIRIMTSWKNRVRLLERLNYVSNGELTQKGWFAKHIYSHEIEISEIFTTKIFDTLTTKEIVLLIAGIIYEPRRSDKFYGKAKPIIKELLPKINKNSYISRKLNPLNLKKLCLIIDMWIDECEFADLIPLSNLLEGDIIRLFRQIIDYLRQIRKGFNEESKRKRIETCLDKIDRDLIRVEF